MSQCKNPCDNPECMKLRKELIDLRAMHSSLKSFVCQVVVWIEKFEKKHWGI